MSESLTPQQFVEKWRVSTLKESAAYQSHFDDLCRMLEHPTPAEMDPTGQRFTYQKGVVKDLAAGRKEETLFGARAVTETRRELPLHCVGAVPGLWRPVPT
jgi:hypothetical protein